jgi:cell division septation protein DedD
MRNPSLHAALRAFALEAASTLTHAADSGDELGYDVAEEPGSGPSLYSYRALTAEYIGAHWPALAALPSLEAAAHELGAGATTWLRSHGMAGAEAEPALRAMLERLYEDASSFDFPEERFERVYGELERTLFHGTARQAAVAPLRRARMECARIDLGSGVALVRADRADAPREAAWPHPQLESDGEPGVLIVIEREAEGGAELPLGRARARFADVVRGLRLWGPGALAPAGSAWVRSDDGPWQYFDLDPLGPGRGEPWTIAEDEADDLREFLAAIEQARVPGRIAWALERFELGCERARDSEALPDFLMALRALLDASDEQGQASLSLRLAALCAEEPDRRAVQRRTELAFALEGFLMGGGSADAYMDEVGSDSPALLAGEVEACVRALLRDILCGYLDPDLRRTADDILLTSGAPVEIRARDLRVDPDPEREPEPEPEPVAAKPKPKPRKRAKPKPKPEPEPVQEELADGVTPSADWGFEDADCYSAPV